jgi:hypothetical protein
MFNCLVTILSYLQKEKKIAPHYKIDNNLIKCQITKYK